MVLYLKIILLIRTIKCSCKGNCQFRRPGKVTGFNKSSRRPIQGANVYFIKEKTTQSIICFNWNIDLIMFKLMALLICLWAKQNAWFAIIWLVIINAASWKRFECLGRTSTIYAKLRNNSLVNRVRLPKNARLGEPGIIVSLDPIERPCINCGLKVHLDRKFVLLVVDQRTKFSICCELKIRFHLLSSKESLAKQLVLDAIFLIDQSAELSRALIHWLLLSTLAYLPE